VTFPSAKQQFEIRYYLWAISESEKECKESFRTLRSFKAGPVWKFHQYVQTLDGNDQLAFLSARLKRFHPSAVQALEEQYSEQENSLLRRFDQFRQVPSTVDQEIQARTLAGEKVRFANKGKIRRVLSAKFKDAFGGQCLGLASANEEAELRFKMKCGGWVVDTFFDFGRHESMIQYSHSISSESTFEHRGTQIPSMIIGVFISFASWLGISSQTEWRYIMDEDIEPVSSAAVWLCDHFFKITPKLLKGLECEKIAGPKSQSRPDQKWLKL
jgi:hypothetical protein